MSDPGTTGFRVYYLSAGPEGEQRRPGPSFPSLEAALEHVAKMVGEVSCDVRLPDGRWYAKQSTVLQPVDPTSEAGKAATEEVAWMKSRPSRGKKS